MKLPELQLFPLKKLLRGDEWVYQQNIAPFMYENVKSNGLQEIK